MSALTKYLYGILCAAVICTVITALTPKSKSAGKLIRMLCGLFLLLSILKPIGNIDLSNIGDFADSLQTDSERIVAQGVEASAQSLRSVIKEECEAYVMEKAMQMGAEISVEIVIAEGNTPVPTDATVTGTVSPYAKQRLAVILAEDLNIPKERQKWI